MAPDPSSTDWLTEPTRRDLPSASPPACSAAVSAQGPCPVCPHLAEHFEPFRRAAYWEAMHAKAKRRLTELEQRIAELEAQLRRREQQLFGKKSESSAGPTTLGAATPPRPSPQPKGQQRGQPGPGRRDYSHLPAVEEFRALPAEQQQCSGCGLPFESFPGTEDSEILEVEVRAYRRLVRRRRYRPRCSCGKHPGLVTAPPAERVIPKSILGVSIWVALLLDKFLFYRPTDRLLHDWQTQGLDLSPGTLTEGLHRLLPLFEPVYQDLIEQNRKQQHWHADETRWLVFATVEGKVGYRWTLWVFHSPEAVVFVLDSGRAHDVPEDHLGPGREGILSVDRYAAYKAMQQVKDGTILLAFCWAHVRRDFLGVARSWPAQEDWALAWVERIGRLYRRNDERLQAAAKNPAAFAATDGRLRQAVQELADQTATELADPHLHSAPRKVLESLREHWDGLTVFVEHPEVPLDNNTAERTERGPVVGRKNYYGSGAVWAGELAAMLFSVLQTLCLWNINPRVWLTEYLQACARSGGQTPAERGCFLPWQMSEGQRQAWSLEKEPGGEDSS
jgi:transposase